VLLLTALGSFYSLGEESVLVCNKKKHGITLVLNNFFIFSFLFEREIRCKNFALGPTLKSDTENREEHIYVQNEQTILFGFITVYLTTVFS
jgi:hypothetical protein